MDMRKLTYFVEVVRAQSFSYAAKKLFVSQPMLSKAISQLESEFGVPLIKRSSKNFQITEAGKIVYQQSVKILNDFDELAHILDDSNNLLRGPVSISIPAEVVSLYFTPFFINIQNKYPEIYINLYEQGSYSVLDLVVRDDVDIGVVMLPVPTHDVDTYQIIDSQCVLAVSEDHPFASREQVDISELNQEKFLLFNRHFTLCELVLQACHSRQFSPNIIFQSARASIILGIVEQNQGITILPEPIVSSNKRHVHKANIVPEIPWKLALIIKKDKYLSNAALKIIEEILIYFNSEDVDKLKHNF